MSDPHRVLTEHRGTTTTSYSLSAAVHRTLVHVHVHVRRLPPAAQTSPYSCIAHSSDASVSGDGFTTQRCHDEGDTAAESTHADWVRLPAQGVCRQARALYARVCDTAMRTVHDMHAITATSAANSLLSDAHTALHADGDVQPASSATRCASALNCSRRTIPADTENNNYHPNNSISNQVTPASEATEKRHLVTHLHTQSDDAKLHPVRDYKVETPPATHIGSSCLTAEAHASAPLPPTHPIISPTAEDEKHVAHDTSRHVGPPAVTMENTPMDYPNGSAASVSCCSHQPAAVSSGGEMRRRVTRWQLRSQTRYAWAMTMAEAAKKTKANDTHLAFETKTEHTSAEPCTIVSAPVWPQQQQQPSQSGAVVVECGEWTTSSSSSLLSAAASASVPACGSVSVSSALASLSAQHADAEGQSALDILSCIQPLHSDARGGRQVGAAAAAAAAALKESKTRCRVRSRPYRLHEEGKRQQQQKKESGVWDEDDAYAEPEAKVHFREHRGCAAAVHMPLPYALSGRDAHVHLCSTKDGCDRVRVDECHVDASETSMQAGHRDRCGQAALHAEDGDRAEEEAWMYTPPSVSRCDASSAVMYTPPQYWTIDFPPLSRDYTNE